jgi:hypothetical protein
MNQDTTLIAARIATLPISAAERRAALAYVSSGETLAALFQAIAKWLNEATPAMRPTYH